MAGKLMGIYKSLLEKHGKQGWWPICGEYRKGDYSTPKNEMERFEICVGAILAQSTSWKGAQKAVLNLHALGAMGAEKLLALPDEKLKSAIKPAGYFNQKAKKLREFCKFYSKLRGRIPAREELLSVWGVGQETADSILLYAYKLPSFVVDAYTKRMLLQEGIVKEGAKYEEIKRMFEERLERDFRIYNEFHALIVQEGKTNRQGKRARGKGALLGSKKPGWENGNEQKGLDKEKGKHKGKD